MNWLPLEGIEVADFSALIPGLVCCSLSGFGQNGPWRGAPALNADGAAVLQEPGFAQDEVRRILACAAAAG